MNAVAQAAVKEIEAMKMNPIISEYVENEAYAKVASELNDKTGGATTAKGVKVLCMSKRNEKILARVNEYIELGYIGVLMAKYN